jgi:hypothetical protein
MKSWSLTFVTQMLFRRSGSERFDTFKNIILLRIFPLPAHDPAVEKHCLRVRVVVVDDIIRFCLYV